MDKSQDPKSGMFIPDPQIIPDTNGMVPVSSDYNIRILGDAIFLQYSSGSTEMEIQVSALGKYQGYNFRRKKVSIAVLGSDRIRIIWPDMTFFKIRICTMLQLYRYLL